MLNTAACLWPELRPKAQLAYPRQGLILSTVFSLRLQKKGGLIELVEVLVRQRGQKWLFARNVISNTMQQKNIAENAGNSF
jgi:hypothetical protein